MAADPGTRDPGDTPSPAEPSQNEGSGSPRQPDVSGDQGQRRRKEEGARHGQQCDQAPRAPKFDGRCDDLSGHIYDYANDRQAADQFTKTSTREICEYVRRTYKYGAALETLSEPTFAKPTARPRCQRDKDRCAHLGKAGGCGRM
jgi:hypothetical protein